MNDTRKTPLGLPDSLARKLYFPWAVMAFAPTLAATTLIFGTLGSAGALINPDLGFYAGTVWAWILCRVNLTRVRVHGRENIDPTQSYVIMLNHQSHFDVLAFYSQWRQQFRWVMKHELRKVPGLGWGCESVGHIFIDRSNRENAIESLRKAREQLAPGTSVVFFPEGRRSPDGRMGEFKKGGFVMAREMGLPILPVSISGSHEVLPAHTRMPLPGNITLTVQRPIDTSQYALDELPELMAAVRRALASGLTPYERGDGSRARS